MLAGFLFSLFLSLFSFRFRWLTKAGSLAQFLLGWLLFGVGGVQWTLPVLVFFLLSSVLSNFAAAKRYEVSQKAEKRGPRDAWQVFANGGVTGVLVLFWVSSGEPLLYTAYLGAVAAAAADTWGTEAGAFSRRQPRLITTLTRVEKGDSGGITPLGTAVGFLGACIVALTGLPWLGGEVPALQLSLAAGGGIFGFLTDSLLGATIQGRFRCPVCMEAGEWKTHCGVQTVLSKGFRWFRNDAVNLVSTAAGALAPLLGAGIAPC
jgi:uncharacterized protein (TIGR00297 family)